MTDVTMDEVFFHLIFGHNIEGVEMLLNNYNVNPNINFMGLSMLSHAIIYNDSEIVKILLKHGAEIDIKSIEIAKKYGCRQIIDILEYVLFDIKEPSN